MLCFLEAVIGAPCGDSINEAGFRPVFKRYMLIVFAGNSRHRVCAFDGYMRSVCVSPIVLFADEALPGKRGAGSCDVHFRQTQTRPGVGACAG